MIKFTLSKICVILVILLAFDSMLSVAARNWESASLEKVSEARVVAKAQEIEIRSHGSTIYVVSSHPVHVKIFTILGQLVSETSLSAGSSQLALGGHGVYIVKVGEFTCKVAI